MHFLSPARVITFLSLSKCSRTSCLSITRLNSFCTVTPLSIRDDPQSLQMEPANMKDAPKPKFERLPKNVVPVRYHLRIQPNLEKFTFTGSEVVQVDVREATNTVLLNAAEIVIHSASFLNEKGAVNATQFTVNEKDEVATIKFDSSLAVGPGKLNIDFSGIINDQMKGFYRSKYVDADGKEMFAGVTQFEPTDARRAFPCWDEPAVKAEFNLTLVVPKDKVTLSNMNVLDTTADPKDPNLAVMKFGTTPKMSTYLLAYVVGDFDYIEQKTAKGQLIRVYAPTGKKEHGRFSLDVAVKSLAYYEKYFNIPYPLTKLDLIAIADFSAGAMENWGLVTYRETALLLDPVNSATSTKQRIAIVVAHELAHQWFGNLVTMEWWTHLWLNEGFATFMEFLCVDDFLPEYDIWTQFVVDTVSPALGIDSLHNSHPVEVPVHHPDEINEIFDLISYQKGASIIRMLHDYIGDTDFKKGMSAYLTKHAYKNTMTEDLWAALEEASKKPIGALMNTWTKLKGYPVISIKSIQKGSSRILNLSQEKFNADGKLDEKDKQSTWMVPITISTEARPNEQIKILMDSKSTTVTLENVKPEHWVKLNMGMKQFYRVQYSPEELMKLKPAIEAKILCPVDRLNLVTDLFAMVESGRVPTVEILKLLQAYVNEDNYSVWVSVITCLGKLNSLLSHTEYPTALHSYGKALLSKIHQRVGWEKRSNEAHTDGLLRSMIINSLAALKDESIIKESKKRFEEHIKKEQIIPADLRGAVYGAVAANCTQCEFDSLLKLHATEDMHEEKNRIAGALGKVKDPAQIKRVLDFAISDKVRSQDAVSVIGSVGRSNYGRDYAWNFFKDNQELWKSRYEGNFLKQRLVAYCTENFATECKAKEIEDFFEKNPFPGTERTLLQSLEGIRLNAAWLQRDLSSIIKYLKQ